MTSSTQFIEMSNPLFTYISDRIRTSYQNACILWIEENINNTLFDAYVTRKYEIEQLRGIPSEERLLFHGTREDIINIISSEGFDAKFNKTSAFGKGIYFAEQASYSKNYSNKEINDISYMFLCNVLIGNPRSGKPGISIDTNKYDSACNDLNQPTIVVSPYNDGSYPRYIIAFHKNSK